MKKTKKTSPSKKYSPYDLGLQKVLEHERSRRIQAEKEATELRHELQVTAEERNELQAAIQNERATQAGYRFENNALRKALHDANRKRDMDWVCNAVNSRGTPVGQTEASLRDKLDDAEASLQECREALKRERALCAQWSANQAETDRLRDRAFHLEAMLVEALYDQRLKTRGGKSHDS